ncbi:hypothetical protein D3C85_1447650 [compost metagenome]
MFAQARQIKESVRAALAFLLSLSGVGNQHCGCCGVITGFQRRVQRCGFPSDGQVQVDSVQQRSRQFVAVTLDHVRCTTAFAAGFAKISTGARIHRGNQLEAGREADTILGAGDYDLAGLKRLP